MESPGTDPVRRSRTSRSVIVAGVAEIPVVRLYGTNGSITINYRTIRHQCDTRRQLCHGGGDTHYRARPIVRLHPGPGPQRYLREPQQPRQDRAQRPVGRGGPGWRDDRGLADRGHRPRRDPAAGHRLDLDRLFRAISTVTLTFSAPLDPTYATNPANYHLVEPREGRGRRDRLDPL